jgi:hypothetical protein
MEFQVLSPDEASQLAPTGFIDNKSGKKKVQAI